MNPAWCGCRHGLLSAAISGEVFASPSTKQIMAAVEKVPSDKGVILCITNYTGDNLHFGLAREKVAGSGRKVGMLRMTDDVGLGRERQANWEGEDWLEICLVSFAFPADEMERRREKNKKKDC